MATPATPRQVPGRKCLLSDVSFSTSVGVTLNSLQSRRLLLLTICVVLVDCAAAPGPKVPVQAFAPATRVYLVNHGWHVGVVVPRAKIPEGVWPQHRFFPDAEYLEVGWGDKRYYMTPDPPLGIMLSAALFPTPSVLHIVGFSGAVDSAFPQNEIIGIDLSEDGFRRLCRYIESSYASDGDGTGQFAGPGLYRESAFFLSRESYHAFNSCNVWTARALREAGCPIVPESTFTAEQLMSRVARFGSVVRTGGVGDVGEDPGGDESCRGGGGN